MSSGYKGYVNDHVEYEILPGTYTFELCTWGNDSPVNCEISTSFTPKAQSFYADNNTVTNVIAHGNEISLDKMYYGVFPACIQESSTYSELTHVPTSFSYKFKFTGGNLYAGFDGERKINLLLFGLLTIRFICMTVTEKASNILHTTTKPCFTKI